MKLTHPYPRGARINLHICIGPCGGQNWHIRIRICSRGCQKFDLRSITTEQTSRTERLILCTTTKAFNLNWRIPSNFGTTGQLRCTAAYFGERRKTASLCRISLVPILPTRCWQSIIVSRLEVTYFLLIRCQNRMSLHDVINSFLARHQNRDAGAKRRQFPFFST